MPKIVSPTVILNKNTVQKTRVKKNNPLIVFHKFSKSRRLKNQDFRIYLYIFTYIRKNFRVAKSFKSFINPGTRLPFLFKLMLNSFQILEVQNKKYSITFFCLKKHT